MDVGGGGGVRYLSASLGSANPCLETWANTKY